MGYFKEIFVHPGAVIRSALSTKLATLNGRFLKAELAKDQIKKSKVIDEIRSRLAVNIKLPKNAGLQTLLTDLKECGGIMKATVFSEGKYSNEDVQKFLRAFMDENYNTNLSSQTEYRAMLCNIAAYHMTMEDIAPKPVPLSSHIFRPGPPEPLAGEALCKLLGHKFCPLDYRQLIKVDGNKLSSGEMECILLHEPSDAMFSLLNDLIDHHIENFNEPKAIASYIFRSIRLGKMKSDKEEHDFAKAILDRLVKRRYGEFGMHMAVLFALGDYKEIEGLTEELYGEYTAPKIPPEGPSKQV